MTWIKCTMISSCVLALTACTWLPQQLPPPRSNVRDIIMDTAMAQVDRPYRYQGAGPSGFDASGLVQYVYAQSGIELPHSAAGQHAQGEPVTFTQIRRGDLLFYQFEESAFPKLHVGIYVGRSRMVHVPNDGRVRLDVVDVPYWQRRFQAAVSYLP